MTLDSSKLYPTWWCDVGSAVSTVAGIWTRSVKCQMRCRLMKEIARCWAWAMEKLNSSISKCTRSVSGNGWWRTAVNVTSTLADKFGIDFRRADYNSNGEPDELEKDEEMEMIPTAVGRWDKLDSYDMGNAKSFKTFWWWWLETMEIWCKKAVQNLTLMITFERMWLDDKSSRDCRHTWRCSQCSDWWQRRNW